MRAKTNGPWVWKATAALAALGVVGCGARTDLDDSSWELEANAPQVDPAADPVNEPINDPVIEPEIVVDPIEEPPPIAPLTTCELEPIWWQPEPIHRLTPAVFEVSPGAHVLMRGGEMFGDGFGMLRMSSGEIMTTYSSSRVEGVDAGWGRSLERGQDEQTGEAIIRVMSADRTRTVFQIPGTSYQRFATLSRDGERVGMVECMATADGTPRGVEMSIWDVTDSSAPLARTTLPERECAWYGANTTHIAITPNGDSLAHVNTIHGINDEGLTPPILSLLHEDGELLETEIPQDDIEDANGRYYGVVSSLTFTPNGDVSAISAGGVRTIFGPSLEAKSTERRGAFVSNPDTYMPPLPMSPTAWTRDGSLEASTALDGAVELRDASGEVVSRLFAPEPSDIANWNTDPDTTIDNAPVMATFSGDGSMVAVGFRKGVGLWGCPEALPTSPRADERRVQLDAPASARVGEPVPLELAVSGAAASDWSVYKLIVDGQLRGSWLDPSQITWRHYQPGRLTLELEVDDGWTTTRSAPRVVEITP